MSGEQGPGWVIRPMRPEDVPEAERLSDESFYELDTRTFQRNWPAPQRRAGHRQQSWIERTLRMVATDPGGCWVVEDRTGLVGIVTSYRRELMWCLATYAVRPDLQGRGIGRPLLEAALSHAAGCLRGMLSSSSDPLAARRYHQAGFTLHPQMFLSGTVDRTAIPVIEKVRAGTPGDRELLDSLDRRTRGAAHGDLHEVLAGMGSLLVSDTSTGQGYAYVANGGIALLAASNRRTAARLMWAALADADGEVSVGHITAANSWAVDVGMTARLQLQTSGYLGLRGMKPPAPYVHNGALL
jgi:predicted N-acetyltransferase YhbS